MRFEILADHETRENPGILETIGTPEIRGRLTQIDWSDLGSTLIAGRLTMSESPTQRNCHRGLDSTIETDCLARAGSHAHRIA